MNATISSLRLTPPSAPNADVSSYHWVHADTTILPVVLRAGSREERSQLEATVREFVESHVEEVHGLINGLLKAFGETTLHINSGRYNQQRAWTNRPSARTIAEGAMTVDITRGLGTGQDAADLHVSSTVQDLREAVEMCLQQITQGLREIASNPHSFKEQRDAV